jgi:hypothetical protein
VVSIESDEPVVGDGDAVSVAAEVTDDLLRPAEGGLGIHNPILTKQHSKESGEVFRLGQVLSRSGTSQPVLSKSPPESGDKLSTEYLAESPNGQEERVSRVNPPFPVRRDPTARNHAVNVGMKVTTFKIP